eukprot:gene23578-25070_t
MTLRFSPSFSAAALAVVVSLSSAAGWTQPARAAELPDAQRTAIEAVVKSYILEHPEIIEDALNILDKRRSEQAALAQKSMIAEKAAMIYNSPKQVVLGNPKGDVTVVEFFDYNCGYCKQALPDMVNLLKDDQKLRFVLKEFPVLSAGSEEAARVAIAVNRLAPEKYMEFHLKLLGSRGQANKAKALDVAASIGLDRAKVEAESGNTDAVLDVLSESRTIATGLGLNGTPSYIVGDTVIPGAIGIDRLKEKIAEARQLCGAGTHPC